jgi:hypothetical protein
MRNTASMHRVSAQGVAPDAKNLAAAAQRQRRVESAGPAAKSVAAGLNFCHTELSPESGWSAPDSAALALSIIEPGLPPARAAEARRRLRHLGLEPYEGRRPELVDALAAQLAKASGAPQA